MKFVNRSGLAVACCSLQRIDGAWVSAVIVKGTFRIVPDAPCMPHSAQRPIQDNVVHMDKLGRSLAWASDLVAFKPHTDFLIQGAFHAPGGEPVATGRASFAFGPLRKELAFHGPRMAVKDGDGWVVGSATPVSTVPLRWEHSAGGLSDRRNPFGKGIDAIPRSDPPRVPLPLIEDPRFPVRTPADRMPPANFAPVPPGFAERQAHLGTRDQRWAVFRAPLPPDDVDPAFHNAAPAGQQAGNYPNGTETIVLTNLHPAIPHLRFALPGVAPRIGILRGTIDPAQPDRLLMPEEVAMALDTVVALPDDDQLVLVWRGSTPLHGEPPKNDVVWAECDLLRVGAPLAPFAELADGMLERFRLENPAPPKPDPDAAAKVAAAYVAAGQAVAAQAVKEAKAVVSGSKLPKELQQTLLSQNDPHAMLATLAAFFNKSAAELSRKFNLDPPPKL
jgi:hypothetical protein